MKDNFYNKLCIDTLKKCMEKNKRIINFSNYEILIKHDNLYLKVKIFVKGDMLKTSIYDYHEKMIIRNGEISNELDYKDVIKIVEQKYLFFILDLIKYNLEK